MHHRRGICHSSQDQKTYLHCNPNAIHTDHICCTLPLMRTPPRTESCCVSMHHRRGIPYSPPKQKTTFTQQSHRHSMPHILAPHAYTATNKVLLCAYATEARNSISIPKSKTHIYAVTTQAIHAAHTCPAHTLNTHHRK